MVISFVLHTYIYNKVFFVFYKKKNNNSQFFFVSNQKRYICNQDACPPPQNRKIFKISTDDLTQPDTAALARE